MASNVNITPGSGDVVAAEDISSVKYQKIKLIEATAASTTPTGVAANPLQVSLANTAANATAVKTDSSATTQPVSAASLPLPSGASTAAKQPALGTAGTASADVITIQGVTSMTPVKVDGSGVTQPVSGTVTANQGGTWTVQPGNTANTTAWKVDGSAVTQPVSGTVTTTPPANASTNVAQVAGTATDTNSGVKSAGTLRVVLATDQPALTNKLLVTPDSVALPANQSVNVSQINGVTPLMGNGTTGTGSARVTISSDNSAVTGLGVGATGAAVPGNSIYQGGNAQTSLPSAATAGNLTGAMYDKFGRQVVLVDGLRDIVSMQTTTISASTSETTVATAVASTFLDVTAVMVSNTSATATRVDFRDTTGGSVLFSIYCPAADTRGMVLHTPMPQTTVNTNWTAQSSVSVTDLRVLIKYIKNK